MAARGEFSKLVRVGSAEFLVDGFKLRRESISHYVLTHFHSDHTVGLGKKFDSGVIYCTVETAALVVEFLNVDPKHIRGVPMQQSIDVGSARLTFLDADHCPGSAIVLFEDLGTGFLTLHTGDCRASDRMRKGLVNFLANRRVNELFLDTTYCDKRWCFPAQAIACQWMQELASSEHAREPRTLFVIGSYQIGKENAVRIVAEEVNSSVYVEQRRWKVIQLSGWGEVLLPSGKPLWTTQKKGSQVWMMGFGSLGHDALKKHLESTNDEFHAIVAFRPTGWSWSPRAMSAGSTGCRAWIDNDGRTRIYSVPYSEHSSYTELHTLVEQLRPQKLIPTVNSDTQKGRDKIMSHFLSIVSLRDDRRSIEHYMCRDCPTSVIAATTPKSSSGCLEAKTCHRKRRRWAAGMLQDFEEAYVGETRSNPSDQSMHGIEHQVIVHPRKSRSVRLRSFPRLENRLGNCVFDIAESTDEDNDRKDTLHEIDTEHAEGAVRSACALGALGG